MAVVYSIVYQPIESEDRSRSREFVRIPADRVKSDMQVIYNELKK